MAFLNPEEVRRIGFGEVGENVLISRHASFYRPSAIRIGSNVRIDDFCILSAGAGGFVIGSYVHIACYSSLIGGGRITLEDFSNISSRVSLYSSSDDFSGETMTNPMVPERFKTVTYGPVHVGRHVIIGCGSVVLPNVMLEEGCAVGALSLVTGNCRSFGMYAGSPARLIKERSRNLLALEHSFRSHE